MEASRIFVLDRNGFGSTLYEPWLKHLPYNSEIVTKYDTDWTPPSSCALLASAQHYVEPEYSILRKAAAVGRPILTIADGILEYRNTWKNPSIASGSIFQPVIGHKIACLGRSQARILESWGNLGKCEVIGAPRFDPILGKSPSEPGPAEVFRILVMTAKRLGFTHEQVVLTKRSLNDLKFWVGQNPRLDGRKIEIIWRLTNGIDRELGVENRLSNFETSELSKLLEQAHAVITTPSTSMLEAMLWKRPVALLDYHNLPLYVPAAWHITSPRHFDQVLPELGNPPAAKMLYQDTVLHDALECQTEATSRMVRLVREMIDIANYCCEKGQPLVFPCRIIKLVPDEHHLPERRFDLAKLYPSHSVFQEIDRSTLQVQINQLEREVKVLRRQLEIKKTLSQALRWIPGPRRLARYCRALHGRFFTDSEKQV